ncbi:hypothetical protein AB0M86_16015 [Streptomyces sp. NPDC051639]|uniref:hypothetical protein n=1 Tax=Streptomyces sp. NPDC051639 TaxID=3155671 RepID=UPI00341AC7CA
MLCRIPGNIVLTGLRDPGVLDWPLEARVGIAPDVALLVQQAPSSAGTSPTPPATWPTRTPTRTPPRRPTPHAACSPSAWTWSPSR